MQGSRIRDGNCTRKPVRQNPPATDNFAGCGQAWYYKLKPAFPMDTRMDIY